MELHKQYLEARLEAGRSRMIYQEYINKVIQEKINFTSNSTKCSQGQDFRVFIGGAKEKKIIYI